MRRPSLLFLLAAGAAHAQGAPTGPAGTLGALSDLANLTMEGAHHRPIRSLAFPGRDTFGWVTGDLAKSTRDRDARQAAYEVGYGRRVGADSVLGLSAGYADLKQTDDGVSHSAGAIHSTFLVADLGLGTGRGETTLTFAYSHSEVDTERAGLHGNTDGNTYTFRARHDLPLGTVGTAAFGAFACASYDHSDLNHYSEVGPGGLAYGNKSNDSTVVRIGLTATCALSAATDLGVTAELAKMLNENRVDHDGTDMATGVADFAMPDVRGKRAWGRLCLDLDHRFSTDAVLSLTLQASTRGDTFDTAAAVSLRKGF